MHLIAKFRLEPRAPRARAAPAGHRRSLVAAALPGGRRFISGMARRARKYYLGLVTITQDVADFLRSDHGRAVLVNAAMKLLLKQDATTVDAVADAFQLTPGRAPVSARREQGRGPAVRSRRAPAQSRIEASPAEHRLATTAPRELEARAEAKQRKQRHAPMEWCMRLAVSASAQADRAEFARGRDRDAAHEPRRADLGRELASHRWRSTSRFRWISPPTLTGASSSFVPRATRARSSLSQLGAAYPQADLRAIVDTSMTRPNKREGEQVGRLHARSARASLPADTYASLISTSTASAPPRPIRCWAS